MLQKGVILFEAQKKIKKLPQQGRQIHDKSLGARSRLSGNPTGVAPQK